MPLEAPAPIAGGGRAHLAEAELFPHVYGPLDLAAIRRAGWLARSESGYAWPTRWTTLAELLTAS